MPYSVVTRHAEFRAEVADRRAQTVELRAAAEPTPLHPRGAMHRYAAVIPTADPANPSKGIVLTRSLLAVLAAATMLVAACSSDTGSETAPAAPASTTAAAGDHTQTSTEVPAQLQFTATTVDGQEFKGESVLGKPAVFWFWAPWCPTCQREAPMVGQLADTRRDVTFIGVAGLDDVPAMLGFVDKYPVKGFSHLADTDGAVWAKFGVTQQPAYAFVGADGSVDVVRGELSEPALTERITALTDQ